MDIVISQQQGRVPVSVLRLTGEVNSSTYERLEKTAREIIDGGAQYILLDLTDLNFLSSAGLRTIHNLFNELRFRSPNGNDGDIKKGLADGTYKSPHLKLLRPSESVLEVLKMTGYDMFIEIHTDMQAAINSF
ncbi:MAG: STAS domain-containing protein [Chloroflexota bacterium]